MEIRSLILHLFSYKKSKTLPKYKKMVVKKIYFKYIKFSVKSKSTLIYYFLDKLVVTSLIYYKYVWLMDIWHWFTRIIIIIYTYIILSGSITFVSTVHDQTRHNEQGRNEHYRCARAAPEQKSSSCQWFTMTPAFITY